MKKNKYPHQHLFWNAIFLVLSHFLSHYYLKHSGIQLLSKNKRREQNQKKQPSTLLGHKRQVPFPPQIPNLFQVHPLQMGRQKQGAESGVCSILAVLRTATCTFYPTSGPRDTCRNCADQLGMRAVGRSLISMRPHEIKCLKTWLEEERANVMTNDPRCGDNACRP